MGVGVGVGVGGKNSAVAGATAAGGGVGGASYASFASVPRASIGGGVVGGLNGLGGPGANHHPNPFHHHMNAYASASSSATGMGAVHRAWRFLYLYRRYAWHFLLACAFFSLYLLLTFFTPVPGCPLGSLDPGCCASKWWDELILGRAHMYAQPTLSRSPWCSSCTPASCPIHGRPSWCDQPYDPEGTLTTLTTIVSCMAGLFFGYVLENEKNHRARIKQWIPFSSACLIIGLIIHFNGFPMNKNLWSPSFTLAMIGIDGLVFTFFYYVIDVKGFKRITHPLICMVQHTARAHSRTHNETTRIHSSSSIQFIRFGRAHFLLFCCYCVVVCVLHRV